jgi:hypothetical protein
MPEMRIPGRALVLAVVLLLAGSPRPAAAALSAEMQKQLGESKYVYIQSQRKNGEFSKPAEIWFFVHDGSVYVGSKKTSWRARRIAAGRTAAKIHVLTADGPSFDATGEIVKDPAAWNLLYETYAKKYAEGWSTYEKNFRDGAADGSRVLIRYAPK